MLPVTAEFLAALPGASWLVLGDMHELGDDAEDLHREVGEAVRKSGVECLFAYGELSRNCVTGFGANGCWYESIDTLIDSLASALEATGDSVSILVKGSRAMRMERVVAALREPGAVTREA